jgi:hypothetical protein
MQRSGTCSFVSAAKSTKRIQVLLYANTTTNKRIQRRDSTSIDTNNLAMDKCGFLLLLKLKMRLVL